MHFLLLNAAAASHESRAFCLASTPPVGGDNKAALSAGSNVFPVRPNIKWNGLNPSALAVFLYMCKARS